ncbi:hypothetical protein HU200_038127 [Digitaria exilis]|uniref:Uncharacterized protein n=1 Tax=Digitaria exilis TaxID=1010633 RepID=A0A835BC88_9POAL|nr:hypothetical protein HU200_038127 [Digitaria exilis]
MEFMASWSEPSKLMNPIFANTIAPEFRADPVDFCMLDVDEFKALPTFLLVKDFYVKKRVVGVDKEELRNTIRGLLREFEQKKKDQLGEPSSNPA